MVSTTLIFGGVTSQHVLRVEVAISPWSRSSSGAGTSRLTMASSPGRGRASLQLVSFTRARVPVLSANHSPTFPYADIHCHLRPPPTPFHLLARLLPSRDVESRRRNYRLTILGVSFLCGSFVTMYTQGAIVYATTRFHFNAKEVKRHFLYPNYKIVS